MTLMQKLEVLMNINPAYTIGLCVVFGVAVVVLVNSLK